MNILIDTLRTPKLPERKPIHRTFKVKLLLRYFLTKYFKLRDFFLVNYI